MLATEHLHVVILWDISLILLICTCRDVFAVYILPYMHINNISLSHIMTACKYFVAVSDDGLLRKFAVMFEIKFVECYILH